MTKEIKISIILLLLGESLFAVNKYLLGNKTDIITDIPSGLLIGVSMGLKITALIILIIQITKKEQTPKK